MSTQPFIGQIKLFAFNFAPNTHALCNGQLLAISTNSALFSLLGTTFGGNGISTFGLPDLQGRAAMHFGQGSGLSNYALGQKGGAENHTLITAEMPSHNHTAVASSNVANQTYPPNNLWADGASAAAYSTTGSAQMNAGAVTNSGGGLSHDNMSPYLVLNYSIALQGIFPSRN